MTKEDIDRLLAARKLVDDYRNLDKEHDLKAQCYADLTAAKTDSLISVTDTKAEIKRIEDNRDAATKTMNDGLKELGFESYSDFTKFNDGLILEAYSECMEITKLSCDKCPTLRCVDLYKDSACYYKTVDETEVARLVKYHTDKYTDFCPKGYGYSWKQLSDFPFDVKWRA